MITFQCASELQNDVTVVRNGVFNMDAVNFELSPLIKMTVPKEYNDKSILEWSERKYLFLLIDIKNYD